jgi:hypothetical protein
MARMGRFAAIFAIRMCIDRDQVAACPARLSALALFAPDQGIEAAGPDDWTSCNVTAGTQGTP